MRRYLVDIEDKNVAVYKSDFIVVGSGAAGLYTALKLSEFGSVAILAKGTEDDTSTFYAQGGIAAVTGDDDNVELHFRDTMEAGCHLGDPESVRILVESAPERVAELIEMGMLFDRSAHGFALGKEGAHSRRRILHTGGDKTGKELLTLLKRKVKENKSINLISDSFALDLLVKNGVCCGVLTSRGQKLEAYCGRGVVLATGGAGQLYAYTTNPSQVTGDGLAMAYRAGAELVDLEYIQFHPTAFYPNSHKVLLISEAVRGEGAYLLNNKNERFMINYHPDQELGPRDVVARAIETEAAGGRVSMDLRHLGKAFLQKRFPGIYSSCLQYGVDPAYDLLPVSPVAHYFTGGIKTDTYGRSTLPSLYAVGEAASTGIHGANRLASNSLLEALVFGYRLAASLGREKASEELEALPAGGERQIEKKRPAREVSKSVRRRIQHLMWSKVGLFRSAYPLSKAEKELGSMEALLNYEFNEPGGWELQNMITLASLVTRAAKLHKESRGCHYRKDYPKSLPEWHCRHLTFEKKNRAKEQENKKKEEFYCLIGTI